MNHLTITMQDYICNFHGDEAMVHPLFGFLLCNVLTYILGCATKG